MTQTVLCHLGLINLLDLFVFTSISVAKTIYAKTARVIYRSHLYAIDEFMITVVNQNFICSDLYCVIYERKTDTQQIILAEEAMNY